MAGFRVKSSWVFPFVPPPPPNLVSFIYKHLKNNVKWNEIVPCFSSLFHLVQTLHKKGGRPKTEEGTWSCDAACLAEAFWFWAEKPTVYYFGWMRLVGCYEHFLWGNPLLFQLYALKSVLLFGIWGEEGGVCVEAQCWQEEMFSRRLTDSDLLLSLLLMPHSLSKLGS